MMMMNSRHSSSLFALVAAVATETSRGASGSFSYDPDHRYGPLSWAAAPIQGNACGGAMQSGIDIPILNCSDGGNFKGYRFAPGSCTFDDMEFVLFPHAVQANYKNLETGCTPPRMYIPGQANPYEAVQFHMHTGSDHALGGVYYGADMHLVHKEVNGHSFAVLGFFLEPTSPSDVPVFETLLSHWEARAAVTTQQCAPHVPKEEDTTEDTHQKETTTTPPPPVNATNATLQIPIDVQNTTQETATPAAPEAVESRERQWQPQQNNQGWQPKEQTWGGGGRRLQNAFNPYDLIRYGASLYTYDGSLTTPPCSEIVFWNVVDVPVTMSVSEYLRLVNLIVQYVDPMTCEPASIAAPSGFTGRPVQAINGRTITRHCGRGAVSGQRVVAPPNLVKAKPASSAPPPRVIGGALVAAVVSMFGLLLATF